MNNFELKLSNDEYVTVIAETWNDAIKTFYESDTSYDGVLKEIKLLNYGQPIYIQHNDQSTPTSNQLENALLAEQEENIELRKEIDELRTNIDAKNAEIAKLRLMVPEIKVNGNS